MFAAATRAKPLDEQRKLADAVLADLGKWGPGEWPARPAVLTWDDGQIVDGYRATARGDKATKESRAQLSFFGSWRAAVLRVEADGAGKLQVLLRILTYLEAAERWEEFEQVRSYVREWYHLPLPATDIPQNPTWQQKICERYSENRVLLPIWLRAMTRPPLGHETGGGHTEAKKPTAQESLSFVEPE